MCSMSFSTYKVYPSIITCFAFNCPCWILLFCHMSTNLVSIKCIWYYGGHQQQKNPIVKWWIRFFKDWSNKNRIFQVRKWFWNKKMISKQKKWLTTETRFVFQFELTIQKYNTTLWFSFTSMHAFDYVHASIGSFYVVIIFTLFLLIVCFVFCN